MNLIFKKITTDDIAKLQQIAKDTFRETFGHHNTDAELAAYFNTAFSHETLTKEVMNPESQHYFAILDGTIAGYLKLNQGTAQTEQELENAFEVQRIYVLQAFQGQGLGKFLFEKALQLACETDCEWVWLGVWDQNYKAQRFYAKYQFERFGEHQFPVADKVDTDWLLRRSVASLQAQFGNK